MRARRRHREERPPAGYEVRTADGGALAGEVHEADARGVAVRHLPGHPGRMRWVPWGAVAGVDAAGRVLTLAPGVEVRDVLRAPAPLGRGPGDAEWWAHVCEHYGAAAAAPVPGAAATLPPDARDATPRALR